ncbi:MAG: hypothetical protein GX455_00940 [Phycisphaerae bacterium]|nr:hypothetical protein [Phycisphaerae bacterium]
MSHILRREFLAGVGMAVGGMIIASNTMSGQNRPNPQYTTTDIREYLLSHSPWVDRNNTVDTVKSGDPSRPVRKAGVSWFSSLYDIQAAIRAGCDLLIVHEPTFWEHAAGETSWRNRGPGNAKSKVLADSGLVVLRAHDTWDNWPEIGIRDSWAKFLGLTCRLREGTALRWTAVYEIPEIPLCDFAQTLANRIYPLGENSVQVIGDPKRKVCHPALGVGCVVPDQEMIDFGADVLIMCYDGASYWSCRERLVESGAAIITVEHGTSEIPGMIALRDHLAGQFPSVEFVWIAEHPHTWTVQGSA